MCCVVFVQLLLYCLFWYLYNIVLIVYIISCLFVLCTSFVCLFVLCTSFVCLLVFIFFRSLLSRIDDKDNKQLKLVFDSIDKNRDGELSYKELEEFARELG